MYAIGSLIKREREKRKISQEELASGICSVSTLSRIENGEQQTSMENAGALLSKLGIEEDHFINYSSDEEYDRYVLMKKLRHLLSIRQYEDAYRIYNENRVCFEGHKRTMQFGKVITAAHYCYVEKRYETAMTVAKDALRMTIPSYDEKKKIKNLLTDIEITAINIIAVSYWKMNNSLVAINMLTQLVDVLETASESVEYRNKMYPTLLCNLSKWLCKKKRYDEAEILVHKGLEFCRNRENYSMMPYFYCCHAEILEYEEKKQDDIIRTYVYAFVLFDSMALCEDATKLRDYVLKKYGWDLEKIDKLSP